MIWFRPSVLVLVGATCLPGCFSEPGSIVVDGPDAEPIPHAERLVALREAQAALIYAIPQEDWHHCSYQASPETPDEPYCETCTNGGAINCPTLLYRQIVVQESWVSDLAMGTTFLAHVSGSLFGIERGVFLTIARASDTLPLICDDQIDFFGVIEATEGLITSNSQDFEETIQAVRDVDAPLPELPIAPWSDVREPKSEGPSLCN